MNQPQDLTLEIKMSSIVTYSGQMFDYKNPDSWNLWPDDVFVPLSRMPRFSGATSEPYSVLQHSIFVTCIVEHIMLPLKNFVGLGYMYKLSKAALLHDASEAFMCDIPTPLKNLLPDYKEIENIVQESLYNKFCLSNKFIATNKEIIKVADNYAYHIEKSILFEHMNIEEAKQYLDLMIGKDKYDEMISLFIEINTKCKDASSEVFYANNLLNWYDKEI